MNQSISPMPMVQLGQQPEVTLFVESREQADLAVKEGVSRSRGDYLQRNIGSDEVADSVKSISGRISVALNRKEMDQDPALLDLLRQYNSKGIPVDLWANLDDQDGYWVHAGNIPVARQAILEMVNKLESERVKIDRIGLDLEFPIQYMMPRFSLGEYIRTAPWKFSQCKATDQLHEFASELLSVGPYGVDTYEIPILGDLSVTRKIMGIPKAPTIDHPRYKRVGMVYSSVKPPVLPTEPFIERYSKGQGRIPALGIVSSSDQNPGRNINFSNLLDDQSLNRDVKKALEVSPKEFFVFALNGRRMVERVRGAIANAYTTK